MNPTVFPRRGPGIPVRPAVWLRVLALSAGLFLLSACSAERVYYAEIGRTEIDRWSVNEPVSFSAEDTAPERMRLVAEDGGLALYFNDKTADIAVRRLSDGALWHSNPPERFSGPRADALSPQIEITSYVSREVLKVWNSFTDAVQYRQFRTEDIPGGIRVTYLFGRLTRPHLSPLALTEARMREILDALEKDDDVRLVSRLYSRMDLSRMRSEQQKNDLKQRYRILADESQVIYTRKEKPTRLEADRLEAALRSIGYTEEDRDADMQAVGYVEEENTNTHILLPVEYVLERGTLAVRVRMDEAAASPDVRPVEIGVLKYFGAAPAGSPGYALLPDGSGALLRFDRLKAPGLPAYAERVYGRDFGVFDPVEEGVREQVYLPVYGISRDFGGVLAVIEEGAAYASIRADAARREGEYSHVYPSFRLLETETGSIDQAPDSEVNMYAPFAVNGPLSVRFLFLGREDNSYAGMARAYKAYLGERGMLPDPSPGPPDGVPLVAGVLGAIDDIASVAGVPTEIIKPLTTFRQAEDLIRELKREAPDYEPVLHYAGWRQGGMRHRVGSDARAEPKLGGNRDLRELLAFAESQGVKVFMEADFQYVYRDGWFDGFSRWRDAAQHISGELAFKPVYSIVHYNLEPRGTSGYMLNPRKYPEVAERFFADAEKAGIGAVSAGAMGTDLYSSFRSGRSVPRAEAAEAVGQTLRAARDAGFAVAVRGANAYVLPYADFLFDLPTRSGPHPLLDGSVPFLQIVLSGRVQYAAKPLNDEPDWEYAALKAAETGSALAFDVMAAPGEAVKETDYTRYYAVSYGDIRESMLAAGRKVAEALRAAYGREIVDHRQLGEGLTVTVFDGGIAVIVNYNGEDRTTPYGTVRGRDVLVAAEGR